MLNICLSVLFAALGVIIPGVFAIWEHSFIKKNNYILRAEAIEILVLVLCTIAAIFMAITGAISVPGSGTLLFDRIPKCVGYSVFCGMLMAGVMMDILWKEVYEFVWVIALLVIASILFGYGVITPNLVLSLLMYFAIQEMVMSRVYGRADCHAFCTCALAMTLKGYGLEHFATHMLVTWISLVFIQLIGKNINNKLKLKRPVAMIPYIAFGFFAVEIAFVHFS